MDYNLIYGWRYRILFSMISVLIMLGISIFALAIGCVYSQDEPYLCIVVGYIIPLCIISSLMAIYSIYHYLRQIQEYE